MESDSLETRLGTATLSPDGPVVAGSVGQWTLRYVVGSYGIDEGGTIKIARRFASDEERPQFEDPGASGYTTVTTNGEASVRARYDPKGYFRPWMKCVVIDIYDGCLSPGDEVVVVFGDQSQGSPGVRAQSFLESAHEVRVLVDPTNACQVRPIANSPVHPIVAGEPRSLVVVVPTRARVGEPVDVFVKGEDSWGNPTPAPAGVTLDWEGDPGTALADGNLSFASAGSGRVVASWNGTRYPSNPITASPEPPRYGAYWAELHAQSDATVGTGTEVEYFTFGRDWARVDVMSHQGNDFQVTDEDWKRLNGVIREFHEDGKFVIFPGFEWSANTPAGGDRNVMYLEEDMPIMRSSHWQVDESENELTPAHPASALYDKLRAHVDLEKVVVASHCGGRYADIRKYFDDELEELVEVCSCWGVFEWLLWDAFDKGYRVGIMSNSDGHKGRPGAEGPGAGQFGIFGGLTCILAEELTRASVFEALKKRRCYGTSGPRIDLSFELDGEPMGSDLSARETVHVSARVRGTAPIEALVLYRGREAIHVLRPEAFADLSGSKRIRLVWGGARIRGRGRRATWDGSIEVEGANIVEAKAFSFDSPNDGILEQTPSRLTFRSRTTGDLDGIDLWLDQADTGKVSFRSGVGDLEVDLGELGGEPVEKSLGGLDLRASIARYPEAPSQRELALELDVTIPAATTTPIFVKAIQTDGHLAWASPVYIG